MKWRCKVSHFVPTQAIIHNVFKYFLKKDSPYYAEYFFEPMYFTELAQNIVKTSGPNVSNSTTPLQQWGFRQCFEYQICRSLLHRLILKIKIQSINFSDFRDL